VRVGPPVARRRPGVPSRQTGHVADRRTLGELLGAALGATVVAFLALLVVDGLFALLGRGRFGQLSGWLAGILPFWLFLEEGRKRPGIRGKVPMALGSAVLALILGGGAAALAAALRIPPIGSGAMGAAVGAVTYSLLWCVGIRWLADREGAS
jgi:hypothetical protein